MGWISTGRRRRRHGSRSQTNWLDANDSQHRILLYSLRQKHQLPHLIAPSSTPATTMELSFIAAMNRYSFILPPVSHTQYAISRDTRSLTLFVVN